MPLAKDVFREADEEQKQQQIPHGNETILVVDDEKEISVMAKNMLEKFGYRVLVAADAHEALSVFDNHRAEIDLLLSDVIMPGGLNGYELARKLCTIKPDLKVLLASGYAKRAILEIGCDSHKYILLEKPYTMVQLGQTVRAVLDG